MKLFEWLKKLFKRKKPEAVSWTKPYAKSSTIESKVNTYPVKPTLKKGKSTHVRIEPTITEQKYVKMNVKLEPATLKVNEEEIKEVLNLLPKRKPITHPARYRKLFKHRQPTTARKLWKPQAKLPEENNGD
jgi:hypothetical protein